MEKKLQSFVCGYPEVYCVCNDAVFIIFCPFLEEGKLRVNGLPRCFKRENANENAHVQMASGIYFQDSESNWLEYV